MSDAKVVIKVWQIGRFRWFAMVRNLSIGPPYISIDAHGLTKDRAVKKAQRRFDRFMHGYVRRETTTEVRSITSPQVDLHAHWDRLEAQLNDRHR